MEERREEENQPRNDVSPRWFVVGAAVFVVVFSVLSYFAGYVHGLSAPLSMRCDLFFVVPRDANFPGYVGPFRVCYTEENVPYSVLICPTKYSIALRAFPELNVDALEEANTWCTQVRAYVDSLSPAQQEVNASDQNA